VLVSSHLVTELALSAEHLIVIGRGRLLADAPIGDLVTPEGPALEEVYLELTRGMGDFAAGHSSGDLR
jgi:ABC-2 type transport system ATP-binding protein